MDVVVSHANYGLELVDALTGDSLIGTSAVTANLLGPVAPGVKANLEPFLVNGSRWVFEDLEVDVGLRLAAQFYLSNPANPADLPLETGTDLPAVPPTGPGLLVPVEMTPRLGYPFQPSLTRLFGAVVIDIPPVSPAVGAVVTVTPYYGATPGGMLTTSTDEDGQYVMWFLPDPAMTPTLPDSCDVSIDLGGHGGSRSGILIKANQANGTSLITLV